MLVREADVTLKDGSVIRLRSPRASDARELLAYLNKLGEESWRHLNHPPSFFAGVKEVDEAAFLEAHRAHPRSFLVSAWADGKVVGNVACTVSAATLSAHCGDVGIGVLLAYQGRGIGTALLGLAIAEAERAGMWNLHLRVRTFNDRAIALYEKLGFVRVGTLREVALLDGRHADEHVYQRLGAAPRTR